MRRSYFSVPTHSLAAGHHFRQEGFMSLLMVFPQPRQVVWGSSDHISPLCPQKGQRMSSG